MFANEKEGTDNREIMETGQVHNFRSNQLLCFIPRYIPLCGPKDQKSLYRRLLFSLCLSEILRDFISKYLYNITILIFVNIIIYIYIRLIFFQYQQAIQYREKQEVNNQKINRIFYCEFKSIVI